MAIGSPPFVRISSRLSYRLSDAYGRYRLRVLPRDASCPQKFLFIEFLFHFLRVPLQSRVANDNGYYSTVTMEDRQLGYYYTNEHTIYKQQVTSFFQ